MVFAISRAQLGAFQPIAERLVAERIVTWLQATYPAVASRHRPHLMQFVTETLHDGARFGLRGEADLAAYVALAASYGRAWLELPAFSGLLRAEDKPPTGIVAWLMRSAPGEFAKLRDRG